MKRKLLISVLLVSLVGLLPSVAEHSRASLYASSMDDLLSYIPKAAEGVVVINIREASKRGLYEELQKYPEIMSGLKEAEKETGVDLWNEIHYIAIVFNKFQKESDPKIYGLFNTSISEDQVINIIRTKGEKEVNTVNIEGRMAYEVGDNTSKSYFAFGDQNMAVIAENKDDLIAGLEGLKRTRGSITSNPVFSGIFESVNKNHIVWGVIAIPEHAKQEAAAQQGPGAFFAKMKAVYLGFSYDTKGLYIDLNFYVPEAKDAKTLAQTLEGFKGMGKMSVAQEMPEITKYIDLIMITQEVDHVKMSLHLTQVQLDEIEKILDAIKAKEESPEKSKAEMKNQ